MRKIMGKALFRFTVLAALFLGLNGTAGAAVNFNEGWWRAEVSVAPAIDSGSIDRSGDYYASLALEYEFPAAAYATLGLKALPLFVYDGPETVFGAALGFTGRLYAAPQYKGLYAELGSVCLAHNEEFEGNNSTVNFLSGGGVGYEFDNGLNVIVKIEHISNAGLGDKNAGINVLGGAVGYRF